MCRRRFWVRKHALHDASNASINCRPPLVPTSLTKQRLPHTVPLPPPALIGCGSAAALHHALTAVSCRSCETPGRKAPRGGRAKAARDAALTAEVPVQRLAAGITETATPGPLQQDNRTGAKITSPGSKYTTSQAKSCQVVKTDASCSFDG